MNVSALLGHLINFCLPALWMAGAAVLCGGFLLPSRGPAWPMRLGIDFVVALVVLVAGLLWFGGDGKMTTWAMLIAAVALAECLMRRPGRR
ncbi:hypothetical protein [Xylophilus sp. GOD-11R]|uniref:hypothetical protein n=1 Tax=Xylophilus sp. GOD-11R TaxID=3089814 RepID=UPI00298BE29F|nr:hypothetical protein [Xylophilus sp. GOD-11R]WPB55257.1 hypothetical protein R9X41_13980 [Xylophilus sp. GOD-11R]